MTPRTKVTLTAKIHRMDMFLQNKINKKKSTGHYDKYLK